MVLIRKVIFCLLTLLLIANNSCANYHSSNSLQPVSIIELNINPEKYVNKHIHVVGYLSDFPTTLYLIKEYEGLSISGDSLTIIDSTINGDFLDSDCGQKYIGIIGDFKKSNQKNNSSTFYYLTNIVSAQSIENDKLDFCYKKQKVDK